MNLHESRIAFQQLLEDVSNYIGLGDASGIATIEKDYYVTLFLQEIAKRHPRIIFKGGTSLSKCHKIINRFSEDIDFGVDAKTDRVTDSQRRTLKADIVSIIDYYGFTLENPNSIQSRREFNKYIINYNPGSSATHLKQNLIVETSFQTKTFPTEVKEATSYIYDFLKAQNADSIIEEYNLQPFQVPTQTLERTFADKIFAIADYYEKGKSTRLSRHIYDIHMIRPHVRLDDNFSDLFEQVRETRKKQVELCPSAQDGVDLQSCLRRIIQENYYKDDFNNITRPMLFDDITYEQAITTIEEITEHQFIKTAFQEYQRQAVLSTEMPTNAQLYARFVNTSSVGDDTCNDEVQRNGGCAFGK